MLWECFQLSMVFKQINPDLIHSYHYAADYTEPLAAKMAGIKWIYTKKNMSWHGPSYRAWKLRSLLSDGIICQNKDMLIDFFQIRKKTKLIPIGVDIDAYKSQPQNENIFYKLNIPKTSRNIITVANLVPVKGIEILISAFKKLYMNYPEWRLIVIGDDSSDYGIKLKKECLQNCKLKDKVIFTGKQKNIR